MTKKKIKILSLSLLGAGALLVPTAITTVSCAGSKDSNNGSNPGDNKPGDPPTSIEKIPFAIQNGGNFDASSVNLDNSEIAYEAKNKLTKTWAWDSKSLLFTGDSVEGFNQNDITVTINSTDKDSINASIQIAEGKVYVDKEGTTNNEPLPFSIKISGFKPILPFTGFKSEHDIKNALGIISSGSIAQAQQKIDASRILAHKDEIFNGTTNLLKQSTDFSNVGKDAISISQNPYSNDAIKLSITIDKSKIFNANGQPMGTDGQTETYSIDLTGFTPELDNEKIKTELDSAGLGQIKKLDNFYKSSLTRPISGVEFTHFNANGATLLLGGKLGDVYSAAIDTGIKPNSVDDYDKAALFLFFDYAFQQNGGKLGNISTSSGFVSFVKKFWENNLDKNGRDYTFTFNFDNAAQTDILKYIFNAGQPISALTEAQTIKIKFTLSNQGDLPKEPSESRIFNITIDPTIEVYDYSNNQLFKYKVQDSAVVYDATVQWINR